MERESTPRAAERADGEPPDEILTSQEVCDFLKIGRTKLWHLTRDNVIPAYRLGVGGRGSLRYKRSELLRWLEQNRVQRCHDGTIANTDVKTGRP